MALDAGSASKTELMTVASRVVVLKFQEELEKRRQQVAAQPKPVPTPTPAPTPMPRPPITAAPTPAPILRPPSPHQTWLASTSTGSLRQQAANPPTAEIQQYIQTRLSGQLPPAVYTSMGGEASREEIYQRLRRDFLENAYQEYLRQQGQAGTPNQFLGPQVPPPSPPGIGDYISKLPGGGPALKGLGTGYGWLSHRAVAEPNLIFQGQPLASAGQGEQEYQRTIAQQTGLERLASQAIIDTFAGYGVGKGLGLAARGATSLGKTLAPEVQAAVDRLYPVAKRGLLGGEAGFAKIPGGKKELLPGMGKGSTPKVGPKMLPLTEATGSPAEQKMLGMIEGANKAKPEYAAKLAAKRKGVAGAIAAIREQEAAGTLSRGQATVKIAAARRGIIAAKYEFPEELIPSRAEIGELRTQITKSTALQPNDYQNAHDALNALLCGQHIQPHDIVYLEKVFGPQMGEAIRTMQAQPLLKQAWREAIDAANIPRTVFASYDISFPMRQGGLMIGEGAWWRAWKPMIKGLREQNAVAYYDEIMADPLWGTLGKDSGLAIAEPTGKGGIAATQEQFIFQDTLVRRAMQKMPGIQPSQQAYATFGNKLRWDTFKKYITGWDNAGLKYTPEEVKRLANVINIFSGWGKLPAAAERAMPELAQGIFSPRFWASRIEAIPYGIYAAARSPRLMGPMVMRNLGTFIGGNLALAGLAKISGVADMELDPRSSDFMRARIGPLRLDFTAGEGKMFRYFAQLASGMGKAASTGDIYNMNRMRTSLREIQGHLSPQGTILADILSGTTFTGEPVTLSGDTLKSEFWNKMAPGAIQDTVDAIKAFGPIGALAAIPAATGVTTMTYASPWEKMAAAKDAAARDHGFKSFSDMAADPNMGTPKANELIADDPRIATAQKEIDERKKWYGGGGRTMADIIVPFKAAQDTDDAAVAAGTLNPTEWLANYKDRQKALGQRYEEYLLENPDAAKKFADEAAKIKDPFNLPADATPDTVRTAYFMLFDKYGHDTGVITADDWDILGPDLDRFRANLTPAQATNLDENLGAGKSDLVKQHRADSKTFKPYWDIDDQVWQPFAKITGYATYNDYYDSLMAQVVKGGMTREMVIASNVLDNDPIVKLYTSVRADQRNGLLMQNPEIARVGLKYGWISGVRKGTLPIVAGALMGGTPPPSGQGTGQPFNWGQPASAPTPSIAGQPFNWGR